MGQDAEQVNIRIYDSSGRLIREWNNIGMQPGDGVTWWGDDSHGNSIAAGAYFCLVQGKEFHEIEKIIKSK